MRIETWRRPDRASGAAGRVLIAVLGALPSGCGYSSGLRLPEHYHSVGIEVFGNDSPEVDIEREFHAEISRQVVQLVQSPLESPARADVVIDGRMVEYSRWGGIRKAEDNSLLESAVVVRAEAWLVDRRSGATVGERAQSGVRVGYVIDEEDGERRARERALSDVAQRLVLDLFSRLD